MVKRVCICTPCTPGGTCSVSYTGNLSDPTVAVKLVPLGTVRLPLPLVSMTIVRESCPVASRVKANSAVEFEPGVDGATSMHVAFPPTNVNGVALMNPPPPSGFGGNWPGGAQVEELRLDAVELVTVLATLMVRVRAVDS